MGGVGVLHMSWRPERSLVLISVGDGDKKDVIVSYFGGSNVDLMRTCKL